MLVVALSLLHWTAMAQSFQVSNVKRVPSRAINTILTNDELAGYVVLYEVESTDKKVKVYQVDLLDNNLNKAKEFTIVQDAKSYLIEVVFNGDNFMLVFYSRDKTIEYVSFDKTGKKLGSFVVEDVVKYERMKIEQQILQPDVENISVFGIKGQGFIKNGFVDNDKVGYEIVALDQSANKLWSFGSKVDSKELEGADVLSADENFILLNVARKKSLMSKDMSTFLLVINSKTGELAFEIPLKSIGNSDMNLLNAFYDKEQQKIVLIGEIYAPGEEPFKDQSAGLFIQELNEDGSPESTNKYLWEKEIKKAKVAGMTEAQKESEKKSSLYIHRVLRHKDGTLSIIAEQYKKSVSALGVASAVAGGGTSVMEMVIMNMVVMQFNAEKEITSYTIYDKKLKRVNLPGGMGIASSAALAAYMKAIGFFDYSYTSSNRANDEHTIVYTDYNVREEKGGAKNDIILGVLQFNGPQLNASRVPFNSSATLSDYYLAKPGYVLVYEYFKKEKNLKFRLESLKK